MAWFGNTANAGGAVNAPPANNKAVSKFTPDFDGALSSVVMYFSGARAAGSRAVIYDSSGAGALPGNLIAVSTELATGVTGWNKYSFSPSVSLTVAGAPYWLGIWSGTLVNTSCPALTGGIAYNANTYSSTGNPSSPFGASPTIANFVYPITGVYDPAFITTAPNSYRGYPEAASGDPTNSSVGFPTINSVALTSIVANGTINSISWFSNNSGTGHVTAAVYDNTGSGGAPGALLGASNQITNPVMGLNTATFATGVAVAGTVYIGVYSGDLNLATFVGALNSGQHYYTASGSGSSPPSSISSPIPASHSAPIWANSTLGFSGSAVTLGGRIQATSQITTSSVFVISLAGRAKATASLNTAYVAPQNLAGRIGAQSALNMGLSIRLPGRIAAMSSAQSRNLSKSLGLQGGRITASSRAMILPLPTPLSIAGRVTAQSKARLTDPYHVDGLSIAGRIGARSSARLAFGGRFSEFVTLNLG